MRGQNDPIPGDPGDSDPGQPAPTCISETTGHLTSDALYVGLDGAVNLNWYVSSPSGCSPRVTINGVEKTRGDSMPVEHIRTTTTFTLSDEAVYIANVDGVGPDDVIKWSDDRWRISKEGRGPWTVFADSSLSYAYFGRFTGFVSPDLLIMPFWTRGQGRLLEKNAGVLPPSAVFKPYSRYEY